MADTLLLEIATPERLLIQERVDSVQVPAETGYMGVYPGHAPTLAELAPGELTYTKGTVTREVAIGGGYVEVLPDQVRILADSAEPIEEIDVARAEAALKRATDRLSQPNIALNTARAVNAMRRAQVRLRLAKGRVVH